MRGFGAVASYTYPSSPYLLRKDSHTYWAEKPIVKIYVYNIMYDLNDERQQTVPAKLSRTPVENFSDQPQNVSRTIESSVTESSFFTFSQAIQLGISMEITAGSPLIGFAQKSNWKHHLRDTQGQRHRLGTTAGTIQVKCFYHRH